MTQSFTRIQAYIYYIYIQNYTLMNIIKNSEIWWVNILIFFSCTNINLYLHIYTYIGTFFQKSITDNVWFWQEIEGFLPICIIHNHNFHKRNHLSYLPWQGLQLNKEE